jgi:hypothetical protein
MARFGLAFFFVLLTRSTALSQGVLGVGTPPFSTQLSSPYDSVNPANGNILISIPLRRKGGRMPLAFIYARMMSGKAQFLVVLTM